MKPSSLLLFLASRRATGCLGIRRLNPGAQAGALRSLRTLLAAAVLLASGLSSRLLPDDHAAALLIFCVAGPFAGWLLTDAGPFTPENA